MRLSSLQIYLRILELGSFSKASRLEHLSQPAISTIITGLEEEVGFTLLDRSSGRRKRIEPTAEGKIFAKFAKETLENYSQTLMHLANHANQLSPLTISVTASPSASVFPILSNYFQKQYPDIPLHAHQTQSPHHIFQQLLSESTILCVSGSVLPDSRLVSQPFFYDPPVLICQENADIKPDISIADLKKLPLIHRPEQKSNFSQLVLDALKKKGVEKKDLNIILEVPGDADTLHAVSLSPNGVGFISRSLYELNGISSGVRSIHVHGLTLNRYVYLTYKKDVPLPLEARLFIECAKNGIWAKGYFSSPL